MIEAILIIILPPSYSSTLASRHLLREIFVFKGRLLKNQFFEIFYAFFFIVFKPTMNFMCEPDYLNENILRHIENLNLSNENRSKKFTLASNYENFIKLIESSNDLEKLEQFW